MKNPYDILGITPNATNEEVKSAYRALAKKYHPDNYVDSPIADLAQSKMQDINWAYDEILRERTTQGGSNSQKTYTSGSYQGSGEYSRVRVMINNGDINGAESILNGVKKDERNAEWYFLKGCVLTRRGYYFDAIKFIDKACTMAPDNQEYSTMRDNLRAQSTGYGNQPQGNAGGCNMCDVCSTLICLDCLCGGNGGCC
ncbi:MAG: J domain-containing protein [Clostridia bacterium]|nr:J domain-containing protein [Clostridia bacterium]